MLTCKPSVRFAAFPPAMLHMLTVLGAVAYRSVLVPVEGLVITSANDGEHLPTSRHYRNEALDVRSHSFVSVVDKEMFRAELERALGPVFRVLLEDVGKPHEHFHLQVRKGQTFT